MHPAFMNSLAAEPFIFLPDTTPTVSYAAFQLLAFAMQRNRHMDNFQGILDEALFEPLNMTETGLLNKDMADIFAIDSLNMSQFGEPGFVMQLKPYDYTLTIEQGHLPRQFAH